MKKLTLSIFAFLVLLTSCKQEIVKVAKLTVENTAFNLLLKEYNEGKLKLNPINATYAGDNRFNDQFPNTLSDEYQLKTKNFYTDYKAKLTTFKNDSLTESQQMSKAVLDWDCEMALAQNSFKNDVLLPINQMWTINLTIGQLASGSSAQPFKTVNDYENWLSRLDKYNVWLQFAKKRMQQGIKEGYVLPKSLTKKIIPQFKTLATVSKSSEGMLDFSSHLFYSPINNFPDSFSSEEKNKLTANYTAILNDKLVPSFKAFLHSIT